jgi:vacuolar-type H+-ATPase subunit H
MRTLSVDIKELQELIEEERSAEERVKRAKEEAQSILKAAREKAESIERAPDADPSWESLRKAKQEEMMKRKKEMEEEDKRKLAMLQRTAQRNFEKAVEHVVKTTLGEKV